MTVRGEIMENKVDNYGHRRLNYLVFDDEIFVNFIDDQRRMAIIDGKKMKDINYGGLGNIADNGCAVIATYNVLLEHGYKKSFSNVKKSLQLLGAPFVGGLLGTSSSGLKMYLRTKFRVVKSSKNVGEWENIAQSTDSLIIRFRWKKGKIHEHFVACIKQTDAISENPLYKVYNFGNYWISSNRCYNISQIVCILKEHGCIPLLLVGVADKR